MAETDRPRQDPQVRLSGAREEFLATLPGRLDGLRDALRNLRDEPDAPGRREGVVRRLHAMATGARVLGFASVAEALGSAERALVRAEPAVLPDDVNDVERILGTIPLLMGLSEGPLSPDAFPDDSAESAPPAAPSVPPTSSPPLALLVLGDVALLDAVRASSEGLELEHATGADEATRFADAHGPDVIVVDAAVSGAAELVEALASDTPVVVVTTVDRSDASARWVARGAAALIGKPAGPEAIRRAIREARGTRRRRSSHAPIGEVAIAELAERLATEVRRGLLEATAAHDRRIDLGQGAEVLGAVWGAIARVRELVTLRSAGAIRFEPTGPAGAAPVAAWSAADPGGGQRTRQGGRAGRDSAGIPLQGRKIVVADDDPAVAWFVSGLLAAVGVEVIEAHDGLQAERLVFSRWPDALVTDVVMPGKDGFSLCGRVKRDVAVRDVPVVLLSWKEDLLLRMRELGADADAYLRKEAPASLFVERLREVLRPRARVEGRLDSGGEVRGRLDGLTPRLVLELVCRRTLDACVTFNDAAYLYEVEVRDGFLRSATRTASDGSFARGQSVLAGLLGVSAGRFGIMPDRSPCRDQLQGTLEGLLAQPIAKARAAQLALEPERLAHVERVELEFSSISGYLPALPAAAGSLVQGLAEGRPPRELMWSAGGFVERLLDDLARRGAVRAVWGRDGEDRLAAAHAELTPAPDAEPAPPPEFTFQLSPIPPEVGLAAVPLIEPPALARDTDDDKPAGLGTSENAASAALERALAALDGVSIPAAPEVAPPDPEAALVPDPMPSAGIEPDSPVAPPSSPVSDPVPPESQPSESPALDSVVVHLVDSGWDDGPQPSMIEDSALPAIRAVRPIPRRESTAAAVSDEGPKTPKGLGVQLRARAPKELSADALDLGTAVLAAVAQEDSLLSSEPPPAKPVAARSLASAPLPAAIPRPDPAKNEIALARTIKVEPPRAPAKVEPSMPEAARLASIPGPAPTIQATRAVPPKVERQRESPTDSPPAVELRPVKPSREPELPKVATVETRPEPAPAKPKTPPPLSLAEALKRDSSPEIVLSAEVGAHESEHAAREDSSPAIAPVTAPLDHAREERRSEGLPGPDAEAVEDEQEPATERPAPRSRMGDRALGAVRVAFITAAAAALSYGVVRFAVAPRFVGNSSPPAQAAAPDTRSAPVASAAKPPAAIRAAAPRIEDLELPSGIPVAPDKGLLEIDIGERHALYVDGVFVGRGPMRLVPLQPGKHEVEVRASSGEPAKHEVSVRQGRRTRWELAPPPK